MTISGKKWRQWEGECLRRGESGDGVAWLQQDPVFWAIQTGMWLSPDGRDKKKVNVP